jgi:hypothetical protein
MRIHPSLATARASRRLLLAIVTLWPTSVAAQQIDPNLSFNPTRLSVQQTFGYFNRIVPATPPAATPPAAVRAYTSETEIAYMVTDAYRLAIAAPISLTGVANNLPGSANQQLSWNGVAVRNLLIAPIAGTDGSFVALGVDFGYAPLRAILPASPGNRFSTTLTPIVGFHHDVYDLILSPSVTFGLETGGAPVVAPAARLTQRISEGFLLGVEYNGTLGQYGAVPLQNQSHLVFAVGEWKFSGLNLSLGVGYGLTPASNGVAAKLGVGQNF